MGKEFADCSPKDFYLSWEGCMRGGNKRERETVSWTKFELGFHKFNVDTAAKEKLGLAEIRGVLHDYREGCCQLSLSL